MSQVVMRTLQQDETVPILIKVQQLQRRKLQSPDAFASAWNWIDAYLCLEYDEAVHRMLRQARAHSHTPHSYLAQHIQRPTASPGTCTQAPTTAPPRRRQCSSKSFPRCERTRGPDEQQA